MIITKEILPLNIINQNGRSYTEKSIFDISRLNKKEFLGQIGHPYQNTESALYVSHKISNIHISGSSVFGDIEPLDTPCGRALMEILDDVVFRTRGVGHLNEVNEVTDFEITGVDAIDKLNDSFKPKN